jgi:acyl-homoserine-lactone acylase
MKKQLLLLLCCLPALGYAQKFNPAEITRYKNQAKQVTVIRDNWGVPHIYGKTDVHPMRRKL